MRIGFMLASDKSLTGPGDGVRMQAEFQAKALEQLGHQVQRLGPWQPGTSDGLDVIQFFMGGLGFYGIERARRPGGPLLVFAPIIDSNEPFWRYRLAARLGNCIPDRIFTIPGELRKQALGSDLVVVRSTHERDRVVYGLGINASRVQIVLNGVEPPPAVDAEPLRRSLGLPAEYVLHISAYTQARKNVPRLLEAVGPLEIPLVIAGSAEPGELNDRIVKLAQNYGHVRLLGFQNRESLHALYAGAKVFCLPSVHEGTGLVALEAAAQGAQVVITQNGGPRDYFGPLAEYVDPSNTGQIRAAVLRCWQRPADGRLREHVLSHLTWRQSAQSLLAAYNQ